MEKDSEIQERHGSTLEAEIAATAESIEAWSSQEPNLQQSGSDAGALISAAGSLPGQTKTLSSELAPTSRVRSPAVDLLQHQLIMSAPTGYSPEKQSRLQNGAVVLYNDLKPKDAIDSILARLMVALTNKTMDCFDRVSMIGNVAARDVNLRHGIKGAATLADIIKLYENRRGVGQQNVTVTKVKVEAGGQAIVGNVQAGDRREEPAALSAPRSPTKKADD